MRTLAVRFTRAEHRVLSELAAAEGIDLEALIREALAFAPLASPLIGPQLRLVQNDGLSPIAPREPNRALHGR